MSAVRVPSLAALFLVLAGVPEPGATAPAGDESPPLGVAVQSSSLGEILPCT